MERIILIFILLFPTSAFGWSNGEICQAIWKAEGGDKATYQYGIRSVRYDDQKEAKQICLTTVQNNRIRFKKAVGYEGDFLQFLGNRFAPIGAGNDPKKLNRNWQRNVRYFLKKGSHAY